MALSGVAAARAQASLRRQMGPGAFVYQGRAYDATAKNLRLERGADLLPEGDENAAYASAHRVTLNPSDFPAGPPLEGSPCLYLGQKFTIDAAPPPEMLFGTPIALFLIISRTPESDAATDAPAGETGAGSRKQYYPPASTL